MKRLYYCELRVNDSFSSRYVLAKNRQNALKLIMRYYQYLYPDGIITDIQFTPVEYVSQQIINSYINESYGNY